MLDDINFDDRDSKFERTESNLNLRNSKLEKKSILIANSNNKIVT